MPASPPPSHPPAPATGYRARLPNALTMARLALTVVFIAVLAINGTPPSPEHTTLETAEAANAIVSRGGTIEHSWAIWACVLFIIAALTDAADGYLARRWNAVSKFGRIMDPLADKLLILGAFIMLAGHGLGHLSGVAPWMAVVILFRELLVTTARSVFESSGVDFSAAWSGKIKMILQSLAVPLILIDIAISTDPGPLAVWAAWAATIATAISLIPYLTRIAGLMRAPTTD